MKTSNTHRATMELRKLLINECVVALDTNVLSALENPCEPGWLNQFSEMKDSGIRFSIPDICIGEHINSFENIGSACREKLAKKWERMSSRLDTIIWKDLPCLPLRGDLYDLVGIREKRAIRSRNNLFTIDISQQLYQFFNMDIARIIAKNIDNVLSMILQTNAVIGESSFKAYVKNAKINQSQICF